METWTVYIEICLVSWYLLNSPKYLGWTLGNMASSERDQPLAGAFPAIMDKKEVDILQIAKNWNWKEIADSATLIHINQCKTDKQNLETKNWRCW